MNKSSISSASEYRPKDFSDMIGQDAIVKTLSNAIKNDQIPQALLFCGPRGVGKTSCARILAKQINDLEENFEYNIFELDAASNNSVEDIRNITDQIRIPPQIGKYKVYIIDEVHMLSNAAFNAFLKSLEEPPKHVVFILATTEKNKIIPTILSRCQIYDFKKVDSSSITKLLTSICKDKKIKFDENSLALIAEKSDGSIRDSLSIFDRLVSFTDSNLTISEVTLNLNILDFNTCRELYPCNPSGADHPGAPVASRLHPLDPQWTRNPLGLGTCTGSRPCGTQLPAPQSGDRPCRGRSHHHRGGGTPPCGPSTFTGGGRSVAAGGLAPRRGTDDNGKSC